MRMAENMKEKYLMCAAIMVFSIIPALQFVNL